MNVTKEQYRQFLKAYKKAYYVEISMRTTQEISPISWGAPAIATVKLSWTDEGAKCEYNQEFGARITYAIGEQEDIDAIGNVFYIFNSTASALNYLFNGLCKEGSINFYLEALDTLSKSATKVEITANIDQEKSFYGNVPVHTYVGKNHWSLSTTRRTVMQTVT